LWTPPIYLFFLIIDKTNRNSKFRSLSEATPYHHNVFTFTLFLPEGRAGVNWEPSNKIMLFLFSLSAKYAWIQKLKQKLLTLSAQFYKRDVFETAPKKKTLYWHFTNHKWVFTKQA
jgi:hypothetical protein